MTRIIHSVLFDFDLTAPEAVTTALEGLRSLATLPGVVSSAVGADVSPEDFADGYTHAMVVVFASAADRDAYLADRRHSEVLEIVQSVLRRVIAVDIEDILGQ